MSIKHNHPTRDIKPRGKCPACDHYWDNHPEGDDCCRSAATPGGDDE